MFEIRTIHSISLLKVIEKSSFESVSMVLKIHIEEWKMHFLRKTKSFFLVSFCFVFWIFLIFIFKHNQL